MGKSQNWVNKKLNGSKKKEESISRVSWKISKVNKEKVRVCNKKIRDWIKQKAREIW